MWPRMRRSCGRLIWIIGRYDQSSFFVFSFLRNGIGCGNVGISRSVRDFQVPVGTAFWFPWGRHFHSRLPSHDVIGSKSRGCCTPCRPRDRRSWRLLRGRARATDPPACYVRVSGAAEGPTDPVVGNGPMNPASASRWLYGSDPSDSWVRRIPESRRDAPADRSPPLSPSCP